MLCGQWNEFRNEFISQLGVNRIRATYVLDKIRLLKCTITGDKQPQKKKSGCFEQCTSSSANLTMVGLERQQSGVYSFFHETTTSVHASSKTSEPKILVLRLNKVERNYIQEQEPNYLKLYSRKTAKLFETIFKNNNQIIPCYNQNVDFYYRMDQNFVEYKIGIRIKKW